MFNYNCIFREVLGIYCPGCGGTRMVKAILKLDFYQAFRYNPFMFILIVLLVCLVLINLALKMLGKKLILPKDKHLIILAICVILYFILRNIPLFSFLLPTEV